MTKTCRKETEDGFIALATIDDFLFYLKDIEYLKPGLNTKYAGFDNGDLRGGFSTEHDFTMTLWMIGYFDPTIRDDEGNEDFEA